MLIIPLTIEQDLKEAVDALKAKTVDCKVLQEARTQSEQMLKKLNSEIEYLKNKSCDEKVANLLKSCEFCDKQFKCKADLSLHIRMMHHRNQVSQTEEPKIKKEIVNARISDYSCFYCQKRINSSNEVLQKHYDECPQIGEFYEENPPSLKYDYPNFNDYYGTGFALPTDEPCYTCNERLEDKLELRKHYTANHPELVLFWCDVCLTNFGSDRGLKSHMRNQHRIFQ